MPTPNYLKSNPELWFGRKSDKKLYLHEKVECIDFEEENTKKGLKKTLAILGYACGAGVKRNMGRIGSFDGPDAIRVQLGKMPNHLDSEINIIDFGSVQCLHGDMEIAQESLTKKVVQLLEKKAFPILLGGGHDMAYGHYQGIRKFLGANKSLGIINFDAHFDLRDNSGGNNSGTPFYQIAQDCKKDDSDFHYLCLGIRKDANDQDLFETAESLGVTFLKSNEFAMNYAENVVRTILDFIRNVDYVYVTIDLDGFSSAYAPGVSASSPMGFAPQIVLESLELIIASKKLISLDIAEMNPKYDIESQTAKLAASLVHFVMHKVS